MWKRHPRLCRLWLRMCQWSITLDAPTFEVTWFCSDDIHERARVYKIDHELRTPRWLFRPYCWAYGHDDDSYGSCVTCEQRLYDHRTVLDGGPRFNFKKDTDPA
jgi:hypothetical protein